MSHRRSRPSRNFAALACINFQYGHGCPLNAVWLLHGRGTRVSAIASQACREVSVLFAPLMLQPSSQEDMFPERGQENALVFSQGHPLSPGGFDFRIRQRSSAPAHHRQNSSGAQGPIFAPQGGFNQGLLPSQGLGQGRYLSASGGAPRGSYFIADIGQNSGHLGPAHRQGGGGHPGPDGRGVTPPAFGYGLPRTHLNGGVGHPQGGHLSPDGRIDTRGDRYGAQGHTLSAGAGALAIAGGGSRHAYALAGPTSDGPEMLGAAAFGQLELGFGQQSAPSLSFGRASSLSSGGSSSSGGGGGDGEGGSGGGLSSGLGVGGVKLSLGPPGGSHSSGGPSFAPSSGTASPQLM